MPDNQEIHLWGRWLRGDFETPEAGIEIDDEGGSDADRQVNGDDKPQPPECTPQQASSAAA